MCSIFKYENCVGRNFDYEVSYKEELRVISKGDNPFSPKYDVIGMCTGLVKDYPLLYDGMNSNGLVCGGLAFTGNAEYIHSDASDKLHIPSYDFTLRILSECGSVKEAKELLDYAKITDDAYSDTMPPTDLHWFISDKEESIIVEQTKDGLKYYDGSVMTNNPLYPLMEISDKYNQMLIGNEKFYDNQRKWNSRGNETIGLKGDYTSTGRYSRLTYLKDKLESSKDLFNPVSQAFHLCSSVEQIYGVTPVDDKYEYTIYSVVYDMENKQVFFKFYEDVLCYTDCWKMDGLK